MTTICIRDLSNPSTGNEYGISWVAVFPGTVCNVSENSLSYRAECALTGITLVVRKGTNEAGWIKHHLEDQAYTALKSYVTSLVMRNALVSEMYTAVENLTEQAYQSGKEAAQSKMRAALGL